MIGHQAVCQQANFALEAFKNVSVLFIGCFPRQIFLKYSQENCIVLIIKKNWTFFDAPIINVVVAFRSELLNYIPTRHVIGSTYHKCAALSPTNMHIFTLC